MLSPSGVSLDGAILSGFFGLSGTVAASPDWLKPELIKDPGRRIDLLVERFKRAGDQCRVCVEARRLPWCDNRRTLHDGDLGSDRLSNRWWLSVEPADATAARTVIIGSHTRMGRTPCHYTSIPHST